jgi:hypothetical protein
MTAMIELTGAELDAVHGGLAVAGGGLANVAVNLSDIDVAVLNGAEIVKNVDVDIPVSLRDIANNNNVGVGAVIQLLGGVAAVRQRQVQ